MTAKKSICVITTFILISCGGGGGGGGTIETLETSSSNTATPLLTETCSLYIDTTYRCEFTHNGLERFYFIQENHPESSGLSSVLFVLHGYGSTALRIRNYSSFNSLANTKENNFLLIHPQGAPMSTTLASSSSHWNSGGWTIGSDVDDVDFIDTVIGFVEEKENIDPDRIYSSGMSNGGFMSYHLACNLSRKIAAIASVTGSMSRYKHLGGRGCAPPPHPTPRSGRPGWAGGSACIGSGRLGSVARVGSLTTTTNEYGRVGSGRVTHNDNR